MVSTKLTVLLTIIFLCFLHCSTPDGDADIGVAENPLSGIQIYPENPFYWMYDGSPILLIGGTMEDNLFQIDSLKEHLELLKSVGGNYVRCTMSARDEGNAKPYVTDEKGLFDLDQFNPEYWNRLEDLLRYADALDIVAQIEIWATYDFYWGEQGWAQNPFNPKLNSNYTVEQSGLRDTIDHPAQSANNAFFLSVPALQNNQFLLDYQKAFVNKIMELSLPYNNVLYSIDNETTVHFEWGKYWSNYIHELAKDHGKKIFVTEMWDSWDPTEHEVEGAIVQHPELTDWHAEYLNTSLHENARFAFSLGDTMSYQFLDVSNHNAQKGEVHYQTGLWVRNAVASYGKIRPINNVKIYGGDRDRIWSGNHQDGRERFWRDVFAGHASMRFHRKPSGLALSEEAQSQIKSLRMLTDQYPVFTLAPANQILSDREENEAFVLANEDQSTILIYFPSEGTVKVNVPDGEYTMSGLDIMASGWMEKISYKLPGEVSNPLSGSFAVALTRN